MKDHNPVERLVSAGGLVYSIGEKGPEVVLCGRVRPVHWALPKGTPWSEETLEETAIREVNEETGLAVRLDGFIDKIHYWFIRSSDNVRCYKTVYFYLMFAVGGDFSQHDCEFDEVRWFLVSEATNTVTYGNEVKVIEKGISMVLG